MGIAELKQRIKPKQATKWTDTSKKKRKRQKEKDKFPAPDTQDWMLKQATQQAVQENMENCRMVINKHSTTVFKSESWMWSLPERHKASPKS